MLAAGAVVEADLVADLGPSAQSELARDARGHAGRGDAARLRHADLALVAAPHLERDLGQLRRLAGAGRARDDHHLVVAQRGRDVRDARRNRQLGRKLQAQSARRGGHGLGVGHRGACY